ncbi:hypothetical protein OG417_48310 [Actinoallomurus sp. NBC_01490]|uniref:hypothetical protein n=1 Tax=Actinoallomurus sp. NBC_01490 TaxID=2903557 RepID=UPI002E35D9E6|nr:hypothetical protein [Actinoallomurus sp. NBC_01490]
MSRKFWVTTVAAFVAAVMLVGFTWGGTTPRANAADAGRRTAASTLPEGTVLASYPGGNTIDTEIREKRPRADGYYHVDTPATINQLKKLHVNTFLFLIWHSPADWQDLSGEFMAAAKRAGINVWAYLVPPSECSSWCSEPYETDYLTWARNVAQLSARYPNLTGWAIDDFTNGQNSQKFTPEYMQQIKQITDGINPKLGLYTTAYYPTAISDAFYEKYAPYIRGIIFPFRDYPYYNTQVTSTLGPELDTILPHADKYHTKVVLMVYTGRYSTFDEPTPDYVKRALDVGLGYARQGRIEGIASYGTPHLGAPAVSSDVLAMYGRGSLVFQNYGGSTPAGAYESASQTVRVDPDAPRYTISLWRYNRFYSTPTAGRLMQVLVDGHVVWSSDLATDMSGGNHQFRWMQNEGPIEIDPSYLRGKKQATLTFRLYEDQAANYRSLTAFDTVQASGLDVTDPGFETPGSWRTESSFGNLIPEINVYDPDLPTHVFQAVARAFAS